MFNKGIVAIRIYYGVNHTPMADLKTFDGITETIQWTDVEAREKFAPYINGYTLIYDERPKRDWAEW